MDFRKLTEKCNQQLVFGSKRLEWLCHQYLHSAKFDRAPVVHTAAGAHLFPKETAMAADIVISSEATSLRKVILR